MRQLFVGIVGVCLTLLLLAGARSLLAKSASHVLTPATELVVAAKPARLPGLAARLPALRASISEESARQSISSETRSPPKLSRRETLAPLVAPLVSQMLPKPSLALQGAGTSAGRVPGFAPAVDGVKAYTRPEGKSGGHGVGWSVIPTYTMKMPDGFSEIATSIADPEGTEIDASFETPAGDRVAVLVLPILRFKDVGFNARLSIDELGSPEKIIKGIGPEFTRGAFTEDDIVSMDEVRFPRTNRLCYDYELKPRMFVRATTCGSRLFTIVVKGKNSVSFRKNKEAFQDVAKTFDVLEDDLCKKSPAIAIME